MKLLIKLNNTKKSGFYELQQNSNHDSSKFVATTKAAVKAQWLRK